MDYSGLPDWWEFRSQYCETRVKEMNVRGRKRRIVEIIDYKNLDVLKAYLQSIMIMGSIHYDIMYNYIQVPLDDDIKEAYNRAAQGTIDTDYEGEKEWGGRLHDLQRVVDGSHKEIKSEKISSKEKACIFLVKKIMERNESCLIYTEYEDSIDRLEALVRTYGKWAGVRKIHLLTGKTKEVDRVKIEEEMERKDVVIVSNAGRPK